MKILILEDEIPAYQKLLSFIQSEISEGEMLGWARSIEEAVLLLKTSPVPDLIFSDIELLDGVSFQVFEQVAVPCPIIFCTGFDQYVLKAFESNGIAYLLKPYSVDNFKQAMAKYHTLFGKTSPKGIDQQTITELKQLLHSDKKSYKQRFTIKKKDGIKLIPVEDIICFEAKGDFCLLIDAEGLQHAVNFKMIDLEKVLNPAMFFRINRSQIIHIAYIQKLELISKNRLTISMKGSDTLLISSSSRTPDFRKWLDG